jgi:hypothetical protein
MAQLDKAFLSHLKHQASAVPARKPTQALTEEQVLAIRDTPTHEAQTVFELAWCTTQRLGDILKLAKTDVSQVGDNSSRTAYVCLTFRRGKVLKKIKPYTIHIPKDHDLGKRLLALLTKKSALLFTEADIHKSIRAALVSVDNNLSVLSIRRGAIQNLSQKGLSTASTLALTQHKNLPMLHHYLANGSLDFHCARERLERGL